MSILIKGHCRFENGRGGGSGKCFVIYFLIFPVIIVKIIFTFLETKEEARVQVFINKDRCDNFLPKLLLLLLPAGEEESKLKETLSKGN